MCWEEPVATVEVKYCAVYKKEKKTWDKEIVQCVSVNMGEQERLALFSPVSSSSSPQV